MKNTTLYDILFIIVTAIILTLVNEFGYSALLSRYSVIVVLIAYLFGKYIGRLELRKKRDHLTSDE